MWAAANPSVASVRSGTGGPEGVGACGWVTVCDELLARGGGAVERVGPVWCGANRLCRRAFRDGRVCVGELAGSGGCHGVVTSGAKHGGTEGDTLRRFLQV